ncbi:hypothetical protein Y1Q_0016928 [Alligator mississippiensis]|uniref:Uncharacterized protein n=1 Tax=Alligator mississippiensis TaxID=8496 RepID=A0A151P1F5_ALLMI|nr:hypothetical protein Y1Q_0016928 [Alligator mississippiensis]
MGVLNPAGSLRHIFPALDHDRSTAAKPGLPTLHLPCSKMEVMQHLEQRWTHADELTISGRLTDKHWRSDLPNTWLMTEQKSNGELEPWSELNNVRQCSWP